MPARRPAADCNSLIVKAQARIASFRRLRGQALWRLLAADHAPEVIGLLQTLLGGDERRLPGSVLAQRLQHELDDLNASELPQELPRTAQAYLADWLAKGYLQRRLPDGAAEEEYELSTQAAHAVRIVAGIEARRSAATESRLSLVIQQLTRLANDTESNPEARLAVLRAERERIDDEIARIGSGRVPTLGVQRAVERTREVISLADELAEDFRRVRDDFEQLNREFRERIIDADAERGEILDALFAGVDLIGQSDAGRSFHAFWALLNDVEQSSQLETALETVLGRGFARKLNRDERAFLRGMTRMLLQRGSDVHDVMQGFARSLRGFVQSRGYLEQRRLNQLLRQAQAEALGLRETVRPTQSTGYVLPLSSSRLRSLSQWRLRDPRHADVDGVIHVGDGATISLDSVGDLVAQSEIDFRALRHDIVDLLVDREQLSIGDALTARPAAQGLGSVIGYLSLGSRHGIVADDRVETVRWRGQDGVVRQARIPLVWFTRSSFSTEPA